MLVQACLLPDSPKKRVSARRTPARCLTESSRDRASPYAQQQCCFLPLPPVLWCVLCVIASALPSSSRTRPSLFPGETPRCAGRPLNPENKGRNGFIFDRHFFFFKLDMSRMLFFSPRPPPPFPLNINHFLPERERDDLMPLAHGQGEEEKGGREGGRVRDPPAFWHPSSCVRVEFPI